MPLILCLANYLLVYSVEDRKRANMSRQNAPDSTTAYHNFPAFIPNSFILPTPPKSNMLLNPYILAGKTLRTTYVPLIFTAVDTMIVTSIKSSESGDLQYTSNLHVDYLSTS
ncbi:hypothetical protein ACN47E_008838 [Coniothyrium glycines]